MNAMPLKQQFFESGSWNYLALPAGARVSLMTIKRQNYKGYQAIMVDENGKSSKHFNSFLSHLGNKIGRVILDAVYVYQAKTIYLLDLIYWNQWFTNHPFEVRQFFLKTKLSDVSQMLKDNQSLGVSIIPGLNQVAIRQLYYQRVDSDFKTKILNSNQCYEDYMDDNVHQLMSQYTPTSLDEQFLKNCILNIKGLIKLDQFSQLYLAKGYIFIHSDSIYMPKIQNDLALILPSFEYIQFQNQIHQPSEYSMRNNMQWRKQLTLFIDLDLNFKTFEGVTVYKIPEDQIQHQKLGLFRVKFEGIQLINQNIELSGVKQIKRVKKSKAASISEVIFLMKILSKDSEDMLTLNKLIGFSVKN